METSLIRSSFLNTRNIPMMIATTTATHLAKLSGSANIQLRRSLQPGCGGGGDGCCWLAKRPWREPVREPNLCSRRHGNGSTGITGGRDLVEWVGEMVSTAYPLWLALACVVGLRRPSTFLWVDDKWQIVGLSGVMLGMGMTLTLDNLRKAMLMPREVLTGFLLQYTVMPLSAVVIGKIMRLPSPYAVGLILVGCCPGGTASNIMTYLARGNVALSVLMTTTSTISSMVMTPFLTSKLVGQYVAVDPTGIFISTVQIVLVPVLIGAFLNQYANALVAFISPLMPVAAVLTSATLLGSVISRNTQAILSSGPTVVLASCCLHSMGFLLGYMISRIAMGIDVAASRTISIEVGMQNSLFGLVLAARHFRDPLTAIPPAISALCHLICGSILVGFWRCLSSSSSTSRKF